MLLALHTIVERIVWTVILESSWIIVRIVSYLGRMLQNRITPVLCTQTTELVVRTLAGLHLDLSSCLIAIITLHPPSTGKAWPRHWVMQPHCLAVITKFCLRFMTHALKHYYGICGRVVNRFTSLAMAYTRKRHDANRWFQPYVFACIEWIRQNFLLNIISLLMNLMLISNETGTFANVGCFFRFSIGKWVVYRGLWCNEDKVLPSVPEG
jgi:hypothetical protein